MWLLALAVFGELSAAGLPACHRVPMPAMMIPASHNKIAPMADSIRLITTNHKTGTRMTQHVLRALCRLAEPRCVEPGAKMTGHDVQRCCRATVVPHWDGSRIPMRSRGPYRLANFVRHPYDLVVSGYLYHRNAPSYERWAHVPLCQRHHRRRCGSRSCEFGQSALCRGARPAPSGESYAQFLRRVDLQDGVLAEMTRLRAARGVDDIVGTRIATDQGGECARTFCLDDFTRDSASFLDLWFQVATHLGFVVRDNHTFAAAIAPLDPNHRAANDATKSHRTFHSPDRSKLRRSVPAYDAAVFNGTFIQAARTIGCLSRAV